MEYTMTLTEFFYSGLSGALLAIILIQSLTIQDLKSHIRTLKSSKRWDSLYKKRTQENRK